MPSSGPGAQSCPLTRPSLPSLPAPQADYNYDYASGQSNCWFEPTPEQLAMWEAPRTDELGSVLSVADRWQISPRKAPSRKPPVVASVHANKKGSAAYNINRFHSSQRGPAPPPPPPPPPAARQHEVPVKKWTGPPRSLSTVVAARRGLDGEDDRRSVLGEGRPEPVPLGEYDQVQRGRRAPAAVYGKGRTLADVLGH